MKKLIDTKVPKNNISIEEVNANDYFVVVLHDKSVGFVSRIENAYTVMWVFEVTKGNGFFEMVDANLFFLLKKILEKGEVFVCEDELDFTKTLMQKIKERSC